MIGRLYRWWYRREIADQITEALETGEPPLKACVDCRYFTQPTMCTRIRTTRKERGEWDPVTGRWPVVVESIIRLLHCETERSGVGNKSRCGLDAFFFVPEPWMWRRVWRRCPTGVQAVVVIGGILLVVVMVARLLVRLAVPPA